MISADGYLVTCGHIVSPESKITVKLADYRKYTAKIVANYPEIDRAILKIENLNGAKLPYLKIGSVKDIKRGAFVAALGNALNLNLGKTFTDGHISATRRRLNIPALNSSFIVLQHNVAVNPGNSGGALVDRCGNLVGINNAMLSNASSIGFSIPINTIADYLNKFFNKIDGSSFGLYDVRPLVPEAIEMLHESGFPYAGGLLISKIKDSTPAKEAGLKANDIIVSVGGVLIEMPEDLRIRENVTEPGKEVEFLVWREGKLVKLLVKAVKHSRNALLEKVTITGNHPLNGIEVVALTPELAEKIRMPSDSKGLLVLNDLNNNANIAALSLFGGASFVQKGDLLTKVNDQKLEKPTDLTEALKVSFSNKTFSAHLWRKGQEMQFSINGFGMSGSAHQEQGAGVRDSAKSSGSLQKQDQHASFQEQLKKQLQELFKGRMTEPQMPKQFSSERERLNKERERIINQALKNIPTQVA
ncbi:MAG: trypsin-like peptidase domain-containing protein [Pseudomonadota bacterium]|nr:trypsin-like peptidase domain-containing protein [Pseudomonadota bacterium]